METIPSLARLLLLAGVERGATHQHRRLEMEETVALAVAAEQDQVVMVELEAQEIPLL
jgi:hypothetical protein